MVKDRSKRLYRLSDIRIHGTGVYYGDVKTKPLWKKSAFWARANMVALRFGSLLAVENFKVPGFHSLYLVPTTGRFVFDTRFEPEFTWWHREVRVPIDLAEWVRVLGKPASSEALTLIVDWIERGALAVARRFDRDADPVRKVAALIREQGQDALVPLGDAKNRHGLATADLLIADNYKESRLIVRVERAKEEGVKRQVEVKLRRPHDAFLVCRGIRFDGATVVLKRTNSIATQVAANGFPRRIRVSQMKPVR
jgi:hypothetical protein